MRARGLAGESEIGKEGEDVRRVTVKGKFTRLAWANVCRKKADQFPGDGGPTGERRGLGGASAPKGARVPHGLSHESCHGRFHGVEVNLTFLIDGRER